MMGLFSSNKKLLGPLERAKQKRRAQQPRFAALLALTFSGMVAGLVVLASKTEVPQIIRAPGTIIPLGDYAQIETMDGGIVQAVHVRDGQTVEAGDILVSLRHPDLTREKQVLASQLAAARHELANANAVLTALESDAITHSTAVQDLRNQGFVNASAALELHFEGQRIKGVSIRQQEKTLVILKSATSLAQERVQKKEANLKRHAKLHAQGLRSLNDFLEEEDQVDALRAAVSDSEVRLAEAQNTLAITRASLAEETLTLREKILTRITELEQKIAELQVSVEIVMDKLASLHLSAPARGIIQSVAFPSPGEVIAPGETVFELLPTRQALVVEARIPSSEVGHVNTRHPISISIDSFDVRQHGKVEGRLQSVSPLPLIDERTGETYFRASVELSAASVGVDHFQRPLQAGMTVVAEMTTGEQTLLSYMLKPVQLTMERAFNER